MSYVVLNSVISEKRRFMTMSSVFMKKVLMSTFVMNNPGSTKLIAFYYSITYGDFKDLVK